MATGDEVLRALGELRETIGAAHVARRDLREAIKDTKRLIPEAVAKEVQALVAVLAEETRLAMQDEMRAVIDRLEADWRRKLGL